jgi:hypothetical protein
MNDQTRPTRPEAELRQLLARVEEVYRLGGPPTPDGHGAREPDAWHAEVLSELSDPANTDPTNFAEAAVSCGVDTALGLQALVRLSTAKAVAAAIRFALADEAPHDGLPVDGGQVLDELRTAQGRRSPSGRQEEQRPGPAARPSGEPRRRSAPSPAVRCPGARPHDEAMAFVDYLHRGTGDSPGWTGRGRAETARLLDELERRWCAGGPLRVGANGRARREYADCFMSEALLGLPGEQDDSSAPPGFPAVLEAMGIDSVEALRAFLRLVAVRAAMEAVQWAAAPEARAEIAAAAVLSEIDDPGRAWR